MNNCTNIDAILLRWKFRTFRFHATLTLYILREFKSVECFAMNENVLSDYINDSLLQRQFNLPF